jgi:hypothetical protein
MSILAVIAGLLALWWLIFAIVVARQMLQKRAETSHFHATAAEVAQYEVPAPRFPPWADYLARPTLFLIIPFVVVVHSIVLILLWPGIPLSRFLRPAMRRTHGQ